MVLKYRENYMTEAAAQEKSKLYFVFPNTVDAETINNFNVAELKITPAMYSNHAFVISTTPTEYSDNFLNKVGSHTDIINNVQNLLNLETVFSGINKAIREGNFHGAVSRIQHSDNEDGSKSVIVTQCVAVKTSLNDHNFFFKIFLRTAPFTAFIDQESGKLVADQETVSNITIDDVLEPELYVTDNHGNQFHPESFFNMRKHGIRNSEFNLSSEILKRGVQQTLLQDQQAWGIIVRQAIPQILEKQSVA